MGEVTAPACGPVDGAAVLGAADTGAATIGADVIAAIAPARATRMRAPLCSISISVSPVSVRRSESARIALASMLGGSFLLFISSIPWARPEWRRPRQPPEDKSSCQDR